MQDKLFKVTTDKQEHKECAVELGKTLNWCWESRQEETRDIFKRRFHKHIHHGKSIFDYASR